MSVKTSKTSSSSCCKLRTMMSNGPNAALCTLMKSTRSAEKATARQSRGTSQAKEFNRRCSSSSREPVANVPPQGGRKHPHQEFIQVNTRNILFICGGAFVGLEHIIEQRLNRKAMGFGAEVRGRNDVRLGELLAKVQPEDLLKYGLDPGIRRSAASRRYPWMSSMNDALIRILTEPRNALTKQYEKLLSFEKVKLKFTDGALGAVARKAFHQKPALEDCVPFLKK